MQKINQAVQSTIDGGDRRDKKQSSIPVIDCASADIPLELRIFRKPMVVQATGIGPSTLAVMIAEDRFPKPIKLTTSDAPNAAVGWLASEVMAWLKQRVAQRDAAADAPVVQRRRAKRSAQAAYVE